MPCPYVRVAFDPEQRGRLSLREGRQRRAVPQHRPVRELIHQPVADPQIPGELLDVGLGGEKTVRAALNDEAIVPLGEDHAARAPLALEDDDFPARRGLPQLPRGREARQTRSHDDHRHIHPRSAAAVRAMSASAATKSGSSFNEPVRSRWTPSRVASARYTTSTSYSTSTWSHTNPMGVMRKSRWPCPASSVITAPASGPSHGSGLWPALWKAKCHSARFASFATAAALARSWSGYGSPVARIRSGRLWAVNRTCTRLGAGNRCSACVTRSVTASRNCGWSPQLRTSASSSRPSAASSSFCSYAPTDIAE